MDDLTRFAIGCAVISAGVALAQGLRGRTLRVIAGLIFLALAITAKDL